MTKADEKYMDAKFEAQKEQIISKVSDIVAPVITEVAILKKQQEEQPTINKLWAVVGALVTLVVAMLGIVVVLMNTAKT